MASYTRHLQFKKDTIREIQQRDNYSCLFCRIGYHCENFDPCNMNYITHDIMHFIPKSKLGLGIPENGVEGCRYHHHLLDNGNLGLRTEMLKKMENYLKSIYPKWNKKDLVYRKYKEVK